MEKSWKAAIKKVLTEAASPLHYTDISEQILPRGYYQTDGRRLFEHTVDRLGSRWNRFSWFDLLDVTQEGNLRDVPVSASLAGLVTTLEALLIEALEPPQNRKRGDDFSAVEYIQAIDPELRDKEIQNTLRSIEQKMRGGS